MDTDGMTYLCECRSCHTMMIFAIVEAFCNGFKWPDERARTSDLLCIRGTSTTINIYFPQVKGNARADLGRH